MKTLKSVVSLSMGLMAYSASATTPVPTGTPLNTQQEVGAQVNVIRDTIEDALRKLDTRRPDTKFKMRDYWAQLPQFKQKVSASMDNFRRTLGDHQQGILGRLALAMDRYNSIYESNSFSGEQKKILLEGALKHVRGQVIAINKEYHRAVAQAFTDVFGRLPLRARAEVLAHWDLDSVYKNESAKKAGCSQNKKEFQDSRLKIRLENLSAQGLVVFDECLKYRKSVASHSDWNNADSYTAYYLSSYNVKTGEFDDKKSINVIYKRANADAENAVYLPHHIPEQGNSYRDYYTNFVISREIFSQAYQKTIYPEVKGSCKSELCLGLRSGDLIFTLQLLQTALNRTISVKLADNITTMHLTPLHTRFDEVINILSQSQNPENLPFDTE